MLLLTTITGDCWTGTFLHAYRVHQFPSGVHLTSISSLYIYTKYKIYLLIIYTYHQPNKQQANCKSACLLLKPAVKKERTMGKGIA